MNRLKLMLSILILSALLSGCGGLKFHRDPPQPTLKTAPAGRGYLYKAAVMLTHTSEAPGQLGDLYFEKLVQAMGRESARIALVTPQDSDFPKFMASLAQVERTSDTSAVMESARLQGFQGVVLASVRNLRVDSRTWSLFWYSRTTYFIALSMTVDLFDPYSGAKLVSRLKEATVKIDFDEYESFQQGRPIDMKAVDKELAGNGQTFGKLVADTLEKQPWKASVISVESGLIRLAADRSAGLAPDQRLAFYAARRVVQNRYGQNFIVPGLKIGEARITRMGDGMIEAAFEEAADIQPGDVAVAMP
jgi:hypothetical protein